MSKINAFGRHTKAWVSSQQTDSLFIYFETQPHHYSFPLFFASFATVQRSIDPTLFPQRESANRRRNSVYHIQPLQNDTTQVSSLLSLTSFVIMIESESFLFLCPPVLVVRLLLSCRYKRKRNYYIS